MLAILSETLPYLASNLMWDTTTRDGLSKRAGAQAKRGERSSDVKVLVSVRFSECLESTATAPPGRLFHRRFDARSVDSQAGRQPWAQGTKGVDRAA